MNDPAYFDDVLTGDSTTVFDNADLLAHPFWAELDPGSFPEAHSQSGGNSTQSQILLQRREEEGEEEDGYNEGAEGEVEEQDYRNDPLLLQEWDGITEPSEDTLRYTVEWKAVLKTKRISMSTEEGVFLAPGAFWDSTLRRKIDESLNREFSSQDRPEPCNTVVVVSVSKRAERDLTKEFAGLDVDWSVIEEKLESWACYFREGKRLTVKVIFRFRPLDAPPQARGGRARPSATRRMRHQQTMQLGAEEHTSGDAAHWRAVYSMLRCPGRPCQNSQGWCWRDPHGGKHYKLLTVHLRQLVDHAKEGNKLDGHQDVPDAIRQQLYAEADQRAGRHRNTRRSPYTMQQMQGRTPTSCVTPAVLPSSPRQAPASIVGASPIVLQKLDIPAPHEDAIRDYVTWQQGRAVSGEWISQYAKAGDILLKQGFTLNHFYTRQLVGLLTDGGVWSGIALSFHNDIPEWLSGYRKSPERSPLFTNETPG